MMEEMAMVMEKVMVIMMVMVMLMETEMVKVTLFIRRITAVVKRLSCMTVTRTMV